MSDINVKTVFDRASEALDEWLPGYIGGRYDWSIERLDQGRFKFTGPDGHARVYRVSVVVEES